MTHPRLQGTRRMKQGFTLAELIVTMAVAGILSLALIGLIVTWISHYAISSTRNALTTSAQTALNQISDDMRQSAGIMPANLVSDPDAPTSVGQWTTSTTGLVLAMTPRASDGSTLNISNGANSANYDNVVYYISNGALYRRYLTAPVTNNSKTTITCTATANGGCSNDTLLAANVQSVAFTLLDGNGNTTTNSTSAASVKMSLQLQQTQSGQSVTTQSAAAITPRTPGQFYTNANFAIGPGGVQFANSGVVSGSAANTAYIQGGVTIDSTSKIGSSATPLGTINVTNYGCGAGPSYGQSCAPAQPIAMGSSNGSMTATTICATNQTTSNGGSSNTLTGFVAGCVASKVFLPMINKSARTSAMTTTATGQTCGTAGCAFSLNANTKYMGDIGGGQSATYTIYGDAYITGSLIGTNQTFKVADSVTTRPVVLVNGPINLTYPSVKANASGITPTFVSFYSANNACSNSDSCNYEGPTDIYNSVNSSTNAITLKGPIQSGGGTVLAGGFYAYFGTLSIVQLSTQGIIGAQRLSEPSPGGVTMTLTNDTWPN